MRSRRRRLPPLALAAALAVALALIVAPAAGAVPAWVSPQRIAPAGASPVPTVAIGAGGHAMAVWQIPSGSVVQAAPYDPTTHRWGRAVNLVAPVPPGDEASPLPTVAVDHNGNAIALWGSLRGVMADRYDAATGSWGPALALSPGKRTKPSKATGVAFDAGGNALAIWSEGRRVIQAARYDAATNSWGPAVDLSVLFPLHGEPRLAVAPNGDAVAVWTRCQGSCGIVQAARYDAATNAWSAAVDVTPRQRRRPRPQVGIQANGNATATSRGGGSVRAARYDAVTDRWSAPVGRPVPEDALFLQAAFGPTGDAIAVWQIRGRRQSTIHAARYHAATNSWGPIRTISAPAEEGGPSRPTGAEGRPQVASGPTGDAIAVWQRPADGATLVQAAHYEASSDRWGDVDDIAGNGAETGLGPAPQVAKGAGGKAIAIWAAVVNGRNAIQAAVYGNACRGRLATHVGTAGNDVLRGTSGADVFDAGAGRDRVFGLRGNDRVCAGPGADIVRGGPGNDSMFGDAGADLLDGNAGRRDRADGGTGADRCIRVFIRRSC